MSQKEQQQTVSVWIMREKTHQCYAVCDWQERWQKEQWSKVVLFVLFRQWQSVLTAGERCVAVLSCFPLHAKSLHRWNVNGAVRELQAIKRAAEDGPLMWNHTLTPLILTLLRVCNWMCIVSVTEHQYTHGHRHNPPLQHPVISLNKYCHSAPHMHYRHRLRSWQLPSWQGQPVYHHNTIFSSKSACIH